MLSHLNYSLENNYRFLNNPKDQVIGVVLQTKDYSQFHMDNLNRNLNEDHAKKLLEKLKQNNSLTLEPILVDKTMKIIDGQHRFWALSQLGLPINYMIDNEISINDAAELNSNQRNWTVMDYVHVYANKGNANYQYLLKELAKYKSISQIGVIADIFSIWKGSRTGIPHKLRNGKYKFDRSNQNINEEFFEFISALHYKVSMDQKIPGNVQEAIKLWYFNPNVDRIRLGKIIDKGFLTKLPRDINLCAQEIGEKYNSRLSTKNKINYYIDNKGAFNFIKED